MDVANLSSNWKSLQARISTDKTKPKRDFSSAATTANTVTLNPLKRKHIASTPSRTPTAAAAPQQKKQKFSLAVYSSNPKKSRRNMGSSMSSSANNETLQTPAAAQGPSPAPAVSTPSTVAPALAGKYIALDCEMVGTYSHTPFSTPTSHPSNPSSPLPEYSILARVSLVNHALQPLYDAYVLPPPGATICAYRTQYSGITPALLDPARNTSNPPRKFEVVQKEVAELLKGRVLVGHALKNDLAVLGLAHPRRDVRDTARHAPFRTLTAAGTGRDGKPGKGRTPSLKRLAGEVLGWGIQGDERGGHSSVEDAEAAMALFKKDKVEFEKEVVRRFGRGAVLGRGPRAANGKGQISAKGGVGEYSGSESEEGDVEESELDEDMIEDEEADLDDSDAEVRAVKVVASKSSMTRGKKKPKRKKRTKHA